MVKSLKSRFTKKRVVKLRADLTKILGACSHALSARVKALAALRLRHSRRDRVFQHPVLHFVIYNWYGASYGGVKAAITSY